MNIYVGNFSYELTENELREAFEQYGVVTSATIIRERYSDASRGFGFIEMPSKKEAESAMEGIKGIKGRMVVVNEAQSKSEHSKRGSHRGTHGWQ